MKNIKTKCSYAKKYKGMRPPKCGCSTCQRIYEVAETKRFLKFIDKVSKEVDKWPAWMKGKADGS